MGAAMSRGRVLLLEDDLALQALLQEALASEGLEVRTCESFEAMRAAATSRDGDIVVADFWGGAQHALDEPARQQLHELGSLLPLILLTGRSWAVNADPADLGIRFIVRKPFDLGELIDTVEGVLAESRS
jgi:DNA-binding response OmpR family regulator